MKKFILTLLLLFVASHAPWRLAGLVIETFTTSHGAVRMTHDDSGYWNALDLEERLMALGWSVEYRKDLNYAGNKAFGLTIPDEHKIYIEEGLHWSDRFAVLAHEAGHTLEPDWVNRPEAESFAEAVALLVTHDSIREHARYLTSIKWTLLMMSIVEWRAMYHAAAVLEDR